MGYYTYHQLTTSDADEVDVHGDKLHRQDMHKGEIGALTGYGPNLWQDSAKWYDCDEDMCHYSQRYPDVVFTLDGDGEEPGDILTKWFKNGRMQSWSLQINPPSEPPEPWA